ncbi:MAG: ABC transporter permease [Bacteroidales bacterium]|nr:ABC transporter permease [Bacteroidales bacterium]
MRPNRIFRIREKRIKPFLQNEGLSVGRMVWLRLRRNRMAMTSLGVIVAFALIAILGYLVTPDSTPYCNQQYLELATMKPMSRATFLCVEQGGTPPAPRHSLLHRMAFGEPLPYTAIPIYNHQWQGDTLIAETYTGSTPNDGEPLRYHRSQVVKIERRTFVFGTDGYGRDVLSQIMIGGRVSLSVGFIAIAIALLIGITLGALAGYYGGWVDNLIMWLINVVWSIPTVLLVIAITFALGKGFWQVFIAVGLTIWVDVARVVRGQVLSLKEKEFVEASRALGYSDLRTIFRHILPNTVGAIIVIAASNFATAILLEAGLSFLGIGVQPPMPSWGSMVKENYGYILLDSAYLAFIPGIAIMMLVLAFMLLGSGLRDALDIKRTDK